MSCLRFGIAGAALLALAACGSASEPSGRPSPARQADPTPSASGPKERFIVCPGNPRCPPEAGQPKGRQPD